MRVYQRIRELWRDTAGQAVTEFGLIAPVLVILLVSIVEFGRAWNVQLTLTEAARLGARTAVVADPVEASQDNVETVVKAFLSNAGIDPESVGTNVTATVQLSPGTSDTVRVTHAYSFTFLGPLLKWANSDFTLGATAVMRNE